MQRSIRKDWANPYQENSNSEGTSVTRRVPQLSQWSLGTRQNLYQKNVWKIFQKTKEGVKLMQHHHVSLDREFKEDCKVWKHFLEEVNTNSLICRPFYDIYGFETAEQLDFYTDSSGAICFGCYFDREWSFGFWNKEILRHFNPSIEFLELFALCVGVFMWKNRLSNRRISIYCDNTSVRDTVNDSSSSNEMSMVLMRLLITECLKSNIRLFVKYIRSSKNVLVDSLSRGNFGTFWNKAPKDTKKVPEDIPMNLWPVEKLWKQHSLWKSFKFKHRF